MTDIKDLAKIKELLEGLKEKLQLEQDVIKEQRETLEEALVILNQILGKESFFMASALLKASKGKPTTQETIKPSEATISQYSSESGRQEIILKSEKTGDLMAEIQVEKTQITITPNPKKKFKVTDPKFKEFFIGKVMKEIQLEDNSLKFTLEKDKNSWKKIIVYNYKDDRQLNRILGALKWTLSQIEEAK